MATTVSTNNSDNELLKEVSILNTTIDNITSLELLRELPKAMEVAPRLVLTCNVDHLLHLKQDSWFQKIYSSADYILCDSKIVQYAAQFLRTPIREKISGADLLPLLYWYYRYEEETIFLLGGTYESALQAQQNINSKVRRTIVTDVFSPPLGFEHNEEMSEYIVNRINNSKATILVVGVGAPKQEKWLDKYRLLMPYVKLFLPLGNAINFEAGAIRRAPKWISSAGLEWLYRLSQEPKRLWHRYLVKGPLFFRAAVKTKITN